MFAFKRIGLTVCAACVCVCFALVSTAPAALLVEESFDGAGYTAAALLNGLNGGTGWAGAWTANSDSGLPQDIQAGNLDNYPGLVNSGNHVRLWACGDHNVYSKASRSFASTIPDAGQTIWLALQLAANDAKEGPSKFYLRDDDADDYVLRVRSEADTRVQTSQNQTLFNGDDAYTPHLLLVKIEMSGGAGDETLTYYLDPDLSADPTGGTVQSASLDSGLTAFKWDGPRASTGMACDMYMDEIRLATTWQEAVGAEGGVIPEPAMMIVWLGLMGICSLAGFRKGRSRRR